MLVVVISVVFAVVAPLVTLPCALFCLCSRIMWTHHHLYVYESVFESGGQFWPKIFRRFVFGLIISQMTITGQFILKEARHQAYATILLMILTYFFLRSTRARYDPTSSILPLEVATVMDISLKQDEDAMMDHNSQASTNPDTNMTSTHTFGRGPDGRVVSLSPRQQDPAGGALIGPHDPFRKAYAQPALRANPRARPEQPFPAAQLGRHNSSTSHPNDGSGGTSSNNMAINSGESISTEGGWGHDSKATVRLKSMNQNDRRLINRWWNDQLQRVGPQNNFAILIGEECGTLTLSGPGSSNGSDACMDLNQPDLTDDKSFV
jgi:Calcium-dependent channel, 7TM region, putative phosphate